MAESGEADSFEDCERFFTHTSPPGGMKGTEARLAAWLQRHVAAGRRVALVTSGGTTVPLERATVRGRHGGRQAGAGRADVAAVLASAGPLQTGGEG